MDKMKVFLKKLSKNLLFITILMITVVFTVYTITKALENDSNSSSNSTSETDPEQKLTSEEIDKVIEDLKISGNIDNILEKLDEIIQRAKLSGNTALQEYASNMKTYYELQKQLDSVKSLIEASKKKNSDIASVDKQVSKILSVTTIVQDLKGAVSDEALLVLESLSDENVKKLQETMAEIESLIDVNDISSLSIQQRSLLDVIILSKLLDENMVEGERLETAENALSVAVTILQSNQKSLYDTALYNSLVDESDKFVKLGKKASTVLPEQIVFIGGYFPLKHAPIMYDGHILLAIEDLYQYIDADIEYMFNNATMVIQSPNKILEIVAGKNVAYLNDEPKNMPVPVLNFNDTIYMSAEFFGEAYDISYKFLPKQECLVFYKDLVQLSNSSVPNQLNKE